MGGHFLEMQNWFFLTNFLTMPNGLPKPYRKRADENFYSSNCNLTNELRGCFADFPAYI